MEITRQSEADWLKNNEKNHEGLEGKKRTNQMQQKITWKFTWFVALVFHVGIALATGKRTETLTAFTRVREKFGLLKKILYWSSFCKVQQILTGQTHRDCFIQYIFGGTEEIFYKCVKAMKGCCGPWKSPLTAMDCLLNLRLSGRRACLDM